MGVEHGVPERVVLGYSPAGVGAYDYLGDTVFIGQRPIEQGGSSTTLEHELIHVRQFDLIGKRDLTRVRHRDFLEQKALENVEQHFSDQVASEFQENNCVHDENAPKYLTLAFGDQKVFEDLDEILESTEADPDDEPLEEAEEYFESVWKDVTDFDNDAARSIVEIHEEEDDFRGDLIEAQAHFWSLFREDALEEIPDLSPDVYPDQLVDRLTTIDVFYTEQTPYSHGDQVRTRIEDKVEDYRQRVQSGDKPQDAAVEIVNSAYNVWKDEDAMF
ncbi:hypothetical protein [Candidatus Nanohalococcus occultus]|uniref:hypothetical protein n=1 Tax=Candidatus Nanohalococcus occultus TaxID=2978047 RepID=UPI0039E01C6F